MKNCFRLSYFQKNVQKLMNSAQYPCFRDCQTSSWPVMSKFTSNELIVSIIKQRRKNSCLNMNLEHLFDIIFFSCLCKYVCLPRIVKKSSSIIFKICIYFHSRENKVHIFLEGRKFLWNLHRRFVLCSHSEICRGDFAKSCGLLKINEL